MQYFAKIFLEKLNKTACKFDGQTGRWYSGPAYVTRRARASYAGAGGRAPPSLPRRRGEFSTHPKGVNFRFAGGFLVFPSMISG